MLAAYISAQLDTANKGTTLFAWYQEGNKRWFAFCVVNCQLPSKKAFLNCFKTFGELQKWQIRIYAQLKKINFLRREIHLKEIYSCMNTN